jgi:hypothetical protein
LFHENSDRRATRFTVRRIQSDVVAGGGGGGLARRDEVLCADMWLHLERRRHSAMRHH